MSNKSRYDRSVRFVDTLGEDGIYWTGAGIIIGVTGLNFWSGSETVDLAEYFLSFSAASLVVGILAMLFSVAHNNLVTNRLPRH